MEETIDGGLEVGDVIEGAALEAALGQGGEESLDGVEPGGRGRGEVETSSADGARAIGARPDACGRHSCRGSRGPSCYRNLPLDGVEEADKFLMPVALHVLVR